MYLHQQLRMALAGGMAKKVSSTLGNTHVPGLQPRTPVVSHMGPWTSRLCVGPAHSSPGSLLPVMGTLNLCYCQKL